MQEKDYFFLSDAGYQELVPVLTKQLVLPKEEFQYHPYKTIHATSCYQMWNIDYAYVLVTEEGWFERQSDRVKILLTNEQLTLGSAIIYQEAPLTISTWKNLTSPEQQNWLKKKDEEIISIELLADIPDFYQSHHKVFPAEHGPNCFATAIGGFLQDEHLLSQWIFPQTFFLLLERNGYKVQESTDFLAKDILVFMENGRAIHACYLLTDHLAFNKSGQTFHNPWHIISLHQVLADWLEDGVEIQTYRQIN